ncbi:radical SAM protein [Thermodesulfobacteriota bacterium]
MKNDKIKPGIDEVAFYWNRYPDVPKEVILKEDILNHGLKFSDEALEAAKGSKVKSYRLFTYDKVSYDQLQKREAFKAPEDIVIGGGTYGLRKTTVTVRLNPNSPYFVDVVDGQLMLCQDGVRIAKVKYPPMPNYYSKTFEDGAKYSEIVAMTAQTAFCTINRACQFWGEKNECKFCDINENVRQAKKSGKAAVVKAWKPIEQVTEVMEEIFVKEKTPGGVRPLAIVLSGGTILEKINNKNEDDFYLEYVAAIKDRIGSRWSLALQTLAKDKATLKRYKATGVDRYCANLEVWDKELFKIICPGKERVVGRDEWVKRLVDAVDVFGEGNVTPNIVAGIETCQPYGFKDLDSAVKSTAEGIEFLMSHGVVVRFNHWNVSPLSALKGNKPPPLEYFIRINLAWCEACVKYSIPPPRDLGPVGPGLATRGHGGYMDMDPVNWAEAKDDEE